MNRNYYNVLGVMSGTSLDGVDLALLKFNKKSDWEFEIVHAETIPYPDSWHRILSEAVNYSDPELEQCNQRYTDYLAGVVNHFIDSKVVGQLDAVCSHGHTVRHQPEQGITLQIGNLSRRAKMIGHTVVCDFRVQDVQLGGQGAPLVPIGDELLFQEYAYCLNLGGFANLSTKKGQERRAYDICAVNTVLNHLAGKQDLAFDRGGGIARSGKLDDQLLRELGSLAFYRQSPPKSLGVEWVHQHVLPMVDAQPSVPDALRTYTVHAATEIARELQGTATSRVLITGGGAYNSYLIEEIQKRTPVQIEIPSDKIIAFKEALIFGFLGVLRLREEVNVLASVTGASQDHVSGVIYKP